MAKASIRWSLSPALNLLGGRVVGVANLIGQFVHPFVDLLDEEQDAMLLAGFEKMTLPPFAFFTRGPRPVGDAAMPAPAQQFVECGPALQPLAQGGGRYAETRGELRGGELLAEVAGG